MEEQKNDTAPMEGEQATAADNEAMTSDPSLAGEGSEVQKTEMRPGDTPSEGARTAAESASDQDFFTAQQPRQPPVQPQQPQQIMQQLPPGYAVDPATGQIIFTGQVYQQSQQVYQQPQQPVYQQPGVVYTPQPTPEELAAQQAAAQQRYGMIVNSVEQFMAGEATVSDVVKTLYTTTSQDDQLWKGVVVGAAAAVLLTSAPVRDAMGKTLGGLFPGLKNAENTGKAAGSAADAKKPADTNSSTSTDKE